VDLHHAFDLVEKIATPKTADLNEIPSETFSEVERKKLRLIILDYERRAWLWSTIRIWLSWSFTIAVAFVVAREYLAAILKALASQ